MNNSFAVIGLGRFGKTVAINLANQGVEVLAIDFKEERVEEVKNDVAFAVTLDATDINALKSQNMKDMDAVVVAIGANFENLLLSTANLIELDSKRILARAMNQTQRRILHKLGIEEVISPEIETGTVVAERLLNPHIQNFFPLPDEYQIAEVNVPKNVAERTLMDIGLENKYHLQLVTILRKKVKLINGVEHTNKKLIAHPDKDTVLHTSDALVLMGKARDIKRFMQINR